MFMRAPGNPLTILAFFTFCLKLFYYHIVIYTPCAFVYCVIARPLQGRLAKKRPKYKNNFFSSGALKQNEAIN
jgi:hypothetical protein